MRTGIERRLFENGGAGPMLLEDIVPREDSPIPTPTPADKGKALVVGDAVAFELGKVATAEDLLSVETAVAGKLDTPRFEVSQQILYIRDEKPAGTNGGTLTAGAWRTRDLNTFVVNSIPGALLINNLFSLPTGTYWIEATAPCYQGGTTRLSIRIAPNHDVLLLGPSTYMGAGATVSASLKLCGYITVQEPLNTFHLAHWSTATRNTDGLGVAINIANYPEIYAEVVVMRIS